MTVASPTEVLVGQNWSIWSPARRQWLLGTVIGRKNARAIIKFDARYEISGVDNELEVDERSILGDANLFRFVQPASLPEVSPEIVFSNHQATITRSNEIASNIDLKIATDAAASEQEEMLKYGITRVPIDQFHFGSYRYTNLIDAVAQAKRSARLTNGVEKPPSTPA